MWRASTLAACVLGLTFAYAGPACVASTFLCESDESCTGLPDGQCEPDGYCSVPDSECLSGRRYANYSGELSGRCVGEDVTSTSDAVSSGDPSTSIDADASVPDDTTTSSSATSTTSTTDPTDPTAEPPPVSTCEGLRVMIDEPFDTAPLDPDTWNASIDEDFEIIVSDGALRFVAIDALLSMPRVTGNFPLPPIGTMGAELTTAPWDEQTMAYLAVVDELEPLYGFTIGAGQLMAFALGGDGDAVIPIEVLPYDPRRHRWLRFVVDQESQMVAWEVGPTPGSWERVTEFELPLSGRGSQLRMGVEVFDGPVTAEPLAAFGHAFACRQ